MARYLNGKDGKIRADLLKKEVLEAHDYVTEIMAIRESISEQMEKAKAKERKLTENYLNSKAKASGLKAWNGFASDYSFDEQIKVETRFAEIVAIDTNVSAGIQKIANWVENLQPNLNRKIKTILKDVLSVKSSGSISKSQLQKLCSYDFEDQEYQKGVHLITSNMKVIDKKAYTEVYKREEVSEDRGKGVKVYVDWQKINVNYASL